MEEPQKTNNRVTIDKSNVCIFRDEQKCKNCGMCKLVCNRYIGVDGYSNGTNTTKTLCVNCGQCALACPFDAINIVDDTQKIKNALSSKKVVVFSLSPAVRVAMGELCGFSAGKNLENKIVGALKKLGAAHVFDTTFGADVTVMEEATELVLHIKSKKLPLFTSCCPAWVDYVKTFIPQKLKNLSSTRSPIAIQGTMIKTYFAKQQKIDPQDIFSVAVAPCSAKKAEMLRPEMNKSGEFWGNENIRDMDAVITTCQLHNLLVEAGIDLAKAPAQKFDNLLAKGSGAGVIFGASGGVMEATLRTAYYLLNGTCAPAEFLNLKSVRGHKEVRSAVVDLGCVKLNVAVVFGTAKAREFLIANSSNLPNFIEVMCCPNGCVGGAGQPKYKDKAVAEQNRLLRAKGLLGDDKKQTARASFENPEIQIAYKKFLKKPNSAIAKQLLHHVHSKQSQQK